MSGNFALVPQGNDGHALGGRDVIRSLIHALRRMIVRRWRAFIGVTTAVIVVGVIAVTMLPAFYTATARIKIDPSRGAALGDPDKVDRPDQSIFDTEVTVIHSRDIARTVVKDLHLLNDPELTVGLGPLGAAPKSDQTDIRISTVADRLLTRLSVERDKMSYIISIGYKGREPGNAARNVNSFAKQYIEYSREKRTGAASREEESLQQRLKSLSRDALAADQQLAQYRAQTGTVSQGSTVTDQQIASVSTQLATAQSEAAAANSNLGVAKKQIAAGGIDAVSAVLGSNVVASLREQRALLLQQQDEIRTRYGPRYPDTVKIKQQIGSIDEQISDEAKRVVGGLESEASAANARAASLKIDLDRLKGQQSTNTKASAVADSYQRQADAAHLAYNRLSEIASATSQLARSSFSQAQVVEFAEIPLNPTSPNRPILVVGVIVFSLIMGFGTIVLQDVLVQGVRTVAEVEQIGLPVLAVVPSLSRRTLRAVDGTAAASLILRSPMGSYAEAFRGLRRELTEIGEGSSPRIVVVVSMLPAEGKTNSALALARVMALSGERTLLVDTDLRRAGVRDVAGINPRFGLTEVLNGSADIDQAVIQDAIPSLDILAVAASNFTTDDLLGGSEWRQMLADVVQRYDRVIIDTAPMLNVTETRTVAALADAVIVIIKWSDTPADAIRTGLGWLAKDNAPVVGAVLSMVDNSLEGYGSLYYSRHYNKYYQQS